MNEREIRLVAHFVCGSECAKGGGSKVLPIFVTEEITKDPRVVEFREKNHKEYDGLVLRTDLPPRKYIPDRGAYTYAHIPLIPDFVPQRQKNFRLQGEREVQMSLRGTKLQWPEMPCTNSPKSEQRTIREPFFPRSKRGKTELVRALDRWRNNSRLEIHRTAAPVCRAFGGGPERCEVMVL